MKGKKMQVNKEISWSSYSHMKLPIQKGLFIYVNEKLSLLEEYLMSKSIKIENIHSQINGMESFSDIYSAVIDDKIFGKIFRIEDEGNFKEKKIYTKVLFQKNTEKHFKEKVINMLEELNKKNKYFIETVTVDEFEISVA